MELRLPPNGDRRRWPVRRAALRRSRLVVLPESLSAGARLADLRRLDVREDPALGSRRSCLPHAGPDQRAAITDRKHHKEDLAYRSCLASWVDLGDFRPQRG